MLRSLVASKTAKLLGTCVCPVVGAAGVTMAVPKVRAAVHKVTAPREVAAPKARTRPVEPVAAPCQTAPVLPLGEPAPMALGDLPAAGQSPVSFSSSGGPLGPTGGPVPGPGPGIGPNNDPTPVSAVPEPPVWMELIFGFTLIGGSIRAATRGLSQADEDQVAETYK